MMKNKYFATIAMLVMAIIILTIPTIHATNDPMANEVLRIVNNERANNGIAPLILDNDLVSAAEVRSVEINSLFAHRRPDGRHINSLSSKIHGENIAMGYTTPARVMNAWMMSPNHKANILNPTYNSIGIAYYKVNGYTYWVQLFSRNKATTTITTPNNPIKVEGLVVSSVRSNKITINWKSQNIANAHGYQVFIYNPKTKTHSLLKTINGNTANSLIISGLASLTTYEYKVRSFLNHDGKTYYSPYSEIKVTTKPLTPSSLKVSPGKKKATVSWKRTSKANGYQIYIATSKNGKYSLKKTINSGSTLKFTDKNLKKRTYYYKIRSYSTVDRIIIYSDFSPAKSVKVK